MTLPSTCGNTHNLSPCGRLPAYHSLLQVPIYVRALDLQHAAELKAAGADYVTAATTEAGMALGSRMLQELGGRDNDIAGLTRAVRKQLDARSSDMMRVLTHELPAPATNVSEEDSVFVFDQAAVGKGDMPSSTALATPGVTTPPRGQETAAAMGLQEAPIDQPVVVGQSSDGDSSKESVSNGASNGDNRRESASNGSSKSEGQKGRDAYRDGAESCPIDSGQSKSYVGSRDVADDS